MRSCPHPDLAANSGRRGVSAVLVVAMLFVFIVCAALTVDVAYMQLIRTELRVATDASAQAAAEMLARTEDQAAATEEAKRYAELNLVGGAPLKIENSDVTFGRVALGESGKWEFTEGLTPPNSVHVQGRIADDARTKAIPLFFAPSLGHDNFSTQHGATASQQDVEICLALDRSGSMLFDMSGDDYSYPRPNPRLSPFSGWGDVWRHHLSAPHPTKSRWAILAGAVDVFLEEAGRYRQSPRVGLVTWGAEYTMPISPNTFYPAVDVDFELPNRDSHNWTTNADAIEDAIEDRMINPMMGGTNMSAGLDEAVAELTGPNSTGLANKVVILMTDGIWNAGRDPLLAAADAKAAGIVVHTVSMLSSDQQTMRDIARITGGTFYSANNKDDLRQAFYELARTLPVVLTE